MNRMIAQGIKELMNNPELRKQMGGRNRKIVIPFCLEQTKKEVVDLIKEL